MGVEWSWYCKLDPHGFLGDGPLDLGDAEPSATSGLTENIGETAIGHCLGLVTFA